MKGILLAGGRGTRLYPMTRVMSKQLLPIYDKPMIYYPLSVLLLAGIREILLISTPEDTPHFQQLFGDGSQLGVSFSYLAQETPRGVADAFLVGEDFIGSDSVCLVLGDNVFHGQGLSEILHKAQEQKTGAVIFACPVANPREFGVVELDKTGNVLSIEEKPLHPKSGYAVPGLYFYDNTVVEVAKQIQPSPRGELEITEINHTYLRHGTLQARLLGRGFAWLDSGTPQGLLQAASYVEAVQSRQGFYIACIEEIAWRQGFLNDAQLEKLAQPLKGTDYGQYLLSLLRGT